MNEIIQGDCIEVLRTLPDASVQCCITSPPYFGLRDYSTATWEGGDSACDHKGPPMASNKSGLHDGKGNSPTDKVSINGQPFKNTCAKCGAMRVDDQIGLEGTPAEYVAKLVAVFREVRRVLRDDGTLWLNLGTSFYGGTPGSGGKTSKQITNAGSFFDGKRPTQSHSDVPACGSDGKEPQGSQIVGRACSDSCDGSQAEKLNRHLDISRNGQCALPSVPQTLQTDRDNAQTDCALTSPGVLFLGVPESTIHASSLHDRASCDPSAKVLESQPNGSPSSHNDLQCVGNSCLNFSMFSQYAKPKDLIPIPWMVAMALQADGWYLRSEIIWHKPNPMPESVTDRPTKAHEQVFLLAKNVKYFYDAEAIKEPSSDPDDDRKSRSAETDKRMPTDLVTGVRPGSQTYPTRNKRSVWTITTKPFRGSHFATFPEDLISPMIMAGTSEKGCCSKCGAPWERVVEHEKGEHNHNASQDQRERNSQSGGTESTTIGSGKQGYNKTTGWEPSCACGEETAPCVVLDPFFGAGTVGVVAKKLGRAYLGVELNPDYITMANDRIARAGENIFQIKDRVENKPKISEPKPDTLF